MKLRVRDDYSNGKPKTREELVEERRKLKPQIGDTVEYLENRFIVAEVGSRYVRMHPENGNTKNITVARVDQIRKIT